MTTQNSTSDDAGAVDDVVNGIDDALSDGATSGRGQMGTSIASWSKPELVAQE